MGENTLEASAAGADAIEMVLDRLVALGVDGLITDAPGARAAMIRTAAATAAALSESSPPGRRSPVAVNTL